MMRKLIMLFWVLSLSLIFSGCDLSLTLNSDNPSESFNTDVVIEDAIVEEVIVEAVEFNLVESSEAIIMIMEDNQLLNLVEWIHPEKWIRFSPYTYIDMAEHNVLFSGDIISDTNQNYIWGYTDGKWDAIEMSISDYISQRVVTQNFLEAEEVLLNQKIARGSNLNNLDEIYPSAESIEYYFSGFEPQYEGMDWKSLTIVFEEFEGVYYVVWIINWSWTI